MPRWRELPGDLDPQVQEFVGQLRRLVDRSGLSVAAVADRTGYSRTSWEKYLDGRQLAPRGAALALAEATGAEPAHLITMWEFAERAWSRAEMRHDMTMEQMRIAQARAALGEFGPPTSPPPGPRGAARPAGGAARPAGGGARPRTPYAPGPRGGRGPAPAAGGSTYGAHSGRRKVGLFLAGTVGALLATAGAVLLVDLGGYGDDGPGGTGSASPSPDASALPPGVKCGGADCTGQDPEAMGCGGQFARTVSRTTLGTATLVELRYSTACKAAWARISGAAPGDTVRIAIDGAAAQSSRVAADEPAPPGQAPDTDTYTLMTAAGDPATARACATLASGTSGCTPPVSASVSPPAAPSAAPSP
ncbi:helix-turn-helix domain-containing protein [Streptomyces sp. PR69]|uniref:helix-turn-helix domain-containing protein n=1 Tax=Streptomyces sp. PR69 TaxID=2984950 RepID=UPI0022647734|nr:XRE family transcriptional regulator [Streptomyces sp. PR69]